MGKGCEYCGHCDRCVPCGDCVCHDTAEDFSIMQSLFLYVGWDGRQSLKVSLTDAQKKRLTEALGGEPNW